MNKPDDPKAAYVAIATRMFAGQGYHGTSLAAVAREAGVTKQALLHFFGTKEKLYAAVLQQLSVRLEGAVDASGGTPTARLSAYFEGLHGAAVSGSVDIPLVVRALLDSDAEARSWPLKPYLDKLLALIGETKVGAGLPEAARLAWFAQQIGTIQYMTIAAPTISGMYGADASSAAAVHCRDLVLRAVEALNAG